MSSDLRRGLYRALVVIMGSLLFVSCSSDDKKAGGGTPSDDAVGIEFFEASEKTIASGQQVILRWQTRNAESVEIVDNRGGVVGIPRGEDGMPRVLEGEVAVHPEETTTYILTATGAKGSATALVRVEVEADAIPDATVSLSVDRERIDAGESVVLSWEAHYANRLILREGSTIVFDEREEMSGHLELRPELTTTYTIEAIGAGASATDEVLVEVQPIIESFVIAAEGPVRSTVEVELRWETKGAAEVWIESDGVRHEVGQDQRNQGRIDLQAGEGTFRLVAQSGDLRAEEEASIEITNLPVIVDFGVEPPVTANEEFPADVTLRWKVLGAEEVALESIPGGPIPIPTGMEEEGSLVIPVTEAISFRMVASNADGSVERTADAIVAPYPEILSFRASHHRVGAGEEVELSWETKGAVEIFLHDATGPLPVDSTLVSGEVTVPVVEESHFTLTARNAVGYEVHRFLEVTVGDPVVLSFEGPLRAAPGGPVDLHWKVLGGDELQILASAGDASQCSTRDLSRIAEGSCTVMAPTEGDEVTYTLRVSNGVGGTDSAEVVVSTHDGPIIEAFTPSRSVLTEGESVLLSWVVRPDLDGNAPELALRDDRGTVYDLTGAGAIAGMTTEPLLLGQTTFTLEASTPTSQRTAKQEVKVQAFGKPAILSFSADPPHGTESEPRVRLLWQTTNAAALEIFALDAKGALGDSVYRAQAGELASGMFHATPTYREPAFRLVVTNEANFSVSEDLFVGVDPAAVLSFTALPNELLEGETTTLSWKTERAEHVRLRPKEAWVESFEPYVDLSQRPTAAKLFSMKGADDGHRLSFPGDFVFPYFGVATRHVVVNARGALSFTREIGAPSSARAMPMSLSSDGTYDSFSYIHMAPFWGDMSPSAQNLEIWYELTTGRDGLREFIIQYKNLSSGAAPDARLNFNVVLREDGSFDFRYGTMESPSDPSFARGRQAVVGFQDHASSYGATLTAYEEFPGGLANRSFHFPALGLGPSVEPFDGSLLMLSDKAQQHNLAPFQAFVDVDPLPDGFVFPHAGVERKALRIYVNGMATFKRGAASPSYSTARELLQGLEESVALSTREVDLAPFWTDFIGITPGELWTDLLEIKGRRVFVVHWKDFERTMPNQQNPPQTHLDYQMLLWEDGTIEYRYGTMSHAEEQELADGKGVSIGFQGGATTTRTGHGPVWGVSLLWDEAMDGGLSNRAFRFHQVPVLPPEGEIQTSPRGTVTYELIARNGHSERSAEREVKVHPESAVVAWTSPEYPLPDQPFHLHWSTRNIASLRVDVDGALLYHVPGPELAEGSYFFANGLPLGIYDFDLVGVGAMAQSTRTSLEVLVGEPVEILSFTGPALPLAVDEEGELEWEVLGGDVRIEDGYGALVYEGSERKSKVKIKPAHSQTYTLRVQGALRDEVAELFVAVRTTGFNDLVASETEVLFEDTVTFDWDVFGGGEVSYQAPVPSESSAVFTDVSGFGNKLTWNGNTPDVPLPFAFPFMGKEYEKIGVGVGIVSLGSTEVLDKSSYAVMPESCSSGECARLAALWADFLEVQPGVPGSGVYTAHLTEPGKPEAFVIQWNRMDLLFGSADVSFQIVLFEDGEFDFRYGSMSGFDQEVADGVTSIIGYQNFDGSDGLLISYLDAYPGGLSNRSFNVGKTVMPPLDLTIYGSGSHTFCVNDGYYEECRTIHVVVPENGMLAITEVMLDPKGGASEQWFEVRNVGKEPLNLDGKVIRAGGVEHTIAAGHPLYIAPGEYAVLAASEIPVVPVDYVWGGSFSLGAPGSPGKLTLHMDRIQLGGMSWQGDEFQRDVSLELNPLQHKRGVIERKTTDDPDHWCQGSYTILDTTMRGSPGLSGSTCTQSWYEVDLLSHMPFIDISESGTSLPGVVQNNVKREIPGGLGFVFPFFGGHKPADSPIWVHSGGFITFSPIGEQIVAPWPANAFSMGVSQFPIGTACEADASHRSCDLIHPILDGAIAPFWAPQRVHAESRFHYQHLEIDGKRVVVLQWSEFSPQSGAASQGRITYQAQLWENGDIVFAYGDLEGEGPAYGSGAHIGIEHTPGLRDGSGALSSPYVQTVANEETLVPFTSTLFRLKAP